MGEGVACAAEEALPSAWDSIGRVGVVCVRRCIHQSSSERTCSAAVYTPEQRSCSYRSCTCGKRAANAVGKQDAERRLSPRDDASIKCN